MPKPSRVRDALVQSLARHDPRTLGQLASEVEAMVSRPARAGLGPPPEVMLAAERTPGPWLGYLFQPGGSSCWLALGWQPAGEAAAMRESVLVDLGDNLGSARIGAVPAPWEPFAAIVLSVEYQTGSLPSEHNLVNDLHAMVMLHDLLSDS
jgi:hypothetical protein